MKFFIALSCLVAFAAANSCDNCKAVVSTLRDVLTSEESIGRQTEVLIEGLCPTSDDEDHCVKDMPELWRGIANLLWPGYYEPTAEWMCGPTCQDPVEGDMTCDACTGGIQGSIDQLLSVQAIDAIVEGLSGEAFCGQFDWDGCPVIVDWTIRNGLPLLAAESDATHLPNLCNTAVPGTCSIKIF